MPKLEPKAIQKELDEGFVWPLYWLYGSERMKSRELLKRIRSKVLGDGHERASPGLAGSLLNEESFDGDIVQASSLLDAALSPALGGGVRLIVIREAHALKEPEILAPLLGPRVKFCAGELISVCVFLAKDLDGRKKFSKTLVERAAVVPCDEVLETEREAWVQYLARRRSVSLQEGASAVLAQLEPWSLDRVDQELEKLTLAGSWDEAQGEGEKRGPLFLFQGGEDFLNSFFTRDFRRSMQCIERFAPQTDESLMLLGLLAWNVRQLALVLARGGAKPLRQSPYGLEKLQRWSRMWTLDQVLELQQWVHEVDFNLKQTQLLPLGVWSSLVQRFIIA